MILEPLQISRPQLRPDVLRLVSLVCHEQPDGHIMPLTELVRVLGVNIAPAFHEELGQRGDLVLETGTFTNVGPKIRRKVRLFGFGVDLAIAARLQGRLERADEGFSMTFLPDHSVVISRFLFQVQLRRLDVTIDHLAVDFAGAHPVRIALVD
jgi:hypothetical protein